MQDRPADFCGQHYLQGQRAGIGPPHRGACGQLYCWSTLAMYDAVSAINGGYAPFAVQLSVPATGASLPAAASAAALGVLRAVFPDRRAYYLDAYERCLETIPAGAARDLSLALGAEVAAGVVALRAKRRPRDAAARVCPGPCQARFAVSIRSCARRSTSGRSPCTACRHSARRRRPSTARPMPPTSTKSRRWAAPSAPAARPRSSKWCASTPGSRPCTSAVTSATSPAPPPTPPMPPG